MKLVLISLSLLTIAITAVYLLRKQKKDANPNEEIKVVEFEQTLSPESSVTVDKNEKQQDKPKRKYTKKSTPVKTSAKKKSK